MCTTPHTTTIGVLNLATAAPPPPRARPMFVIRYIWMLYHPFTQPGIWQPPSTVMPGGVVACSYSALNPTRTHWPSMHNESESRAGLERVWLGNPEVAGVKRHRASLSRGRAAVSWDVPRQRMIAWSTCAICMLCMRQVISLPLEVSEGRCTPRPKDTADAHRCGTLTKACLYETHAM
jgi:hypothetical protein